MSISTTLPAQSAILAEGGGSKRWLGKGREQWDRDQKVPETVWGHNGQGFIRSATPQRPHNTLVLGGNFGLAHDFLPQLHSQQQKKNQEHNKNTNIHKKNCVRALFQNLWASRLGLEIPTVKAFFVFFSPQKSLIAVLLP